MKRSHVAILGALFLFYAVNNYIWLSRNKLPVSYDEGIHLWTSLRFVRAFLHPTHSVFYELMYADTTHWPPLFYFIASLFNLIFGLSYVVSVMTNMLFFLILIVSLYLIGKKLYSPFVGVLSAAILSFYPIIYGHSRLFQLDFALTAIVTFSIYCLISTDSFRCRDRIKIDSWIPPDEISRHLSNTDIGLLPLIQDTKFNRAKSPTKLFEYMAMAKPTVSSNIGEAGRVIHDAINGFLAKDKEEFMVKMDKLITDPVLRVQMGILARRSVEENYSLSVLGRQLYEIIRTV